MVVSSDMHVLNCIKVLSSNHEKTSERKLRAQGITAPGCRDSVNYWIKKSGWMHEIADPNTHLSNKKGILGKQMFCCRCPALMRPTQPWFRLEFPTAIRTKLPSPCLERSREQFVCNRGSCFLVQFSEVGMKQHSHSPSSRYQPAFYHPPVSRGLKYFPSGGQQVRPANNPKTGRTVLISIKIETAENPLSVRPSDI